MKNKPQFMVCGNVPMPETEQTRCSKCGDIIWPSSGSWKHAQENTLKLICLNCFAKLNEYEFVGFIHQGQFLPDSLSNELLSLLEKALHEEKVGRKKRAD